MVDPRKRFSPFPRSAPTCKNRTPVLSTVKETEKEKSFKHFKKNPFKNSKEHFPGLDAAFLANSPENEKDVPEMDMSIEARASIADHARHGTMFESEEIKKNDYSRDETWEMLMNRTDTMSHTSFSTFAAENNSFVMNPSPPVEINNMTLDQSDFFNSSKVYNLMTPEKNKAKVDEASRLARLGELVTKRDMNSFNEFSGSSSGSTTITTDNDIS